jgi:hypothetical protein
MSALAGYWRLASHSQAWAALVAAREASRRSSPVDPVRPTYRRSRGRGAITLSIASGDL